MSDEEKATSGFVVVKNAPDGLTISEVDEKVEENLTIKDKTNFVTINSKYSNGVINLYKCGNLCYIKFTDGTITANANESIAVVPSDCIPIKTVDVIDSYSNKRLQISDVTGDVICTTQTSGNAIRGTFMYMCK